MWSKLTSRKDASSIDYPLSTIDVEGNGVVGGVKLSFHDNVSSLPAACVLNLLQYCCVTASAYHQGHTATSSIFRDAQATQFYAQLMICIHCAHVHPERNGRVPFLCTSHSLTPKIGITCIWIENRDTWSRKYVFSVCHDGG